MYLTLREVLDYIVDNIEISVVQQHHSIVSITGRSISLD
jgi:hypothetical protein